MNPYTQEIFNLLDEGKLNKKLADSIALKHGIEDKTIQKELTELAVVLKAREIANQSGTVLEKFKQIVNLYQNQVILSFRTSQSIMLQQYSTPAPIAYLAGAYVLANQPQNYQIFEPSAGNGLLTVAFDSKRVTVNEIDENRFNNLKSQGFKEISKQDATQPFDKYLWLFNGIITNPPFGTLDKPIKVDEYKISHLDHAMAIRALDCMKHDGRAAIIIGGHTHYDEKGRVQAGKNRIFLTYLYSHYNVDDVINIDGSLYSRQGTSFNVRLILINGRKDKPAGYPSLKNEDSEPVADFGSLFDRVSTCLASVRSMTQDGQKIKLAKAKAKALLLLQQQGLNGLKMTNEFIIGSIPKAISKRINRMDGLIVMNQKSINHISSIHKKELESIGMTAIDFVSFVVNNYNEIRKGRTQELILVVKNGLSKMAIIRMNYEKGHYVVETATIVRNSFINKKELIWQKERTL